MRNEDTAATSFFEEIQQKRLPFGITAQIYQEILQGAASSEKFDYLAEFMESQRFYHPLGETETYRGAARLYFECRRSGITIRSTIDCLIARIAIENDLAILHDDRDFERLAEVQPDITLVRR